MRWERLNGSRECGMGFYNPKRGDLVGFLAGSDKPVAYITNLDGCWGLHIKDGKGKWNGHDTYRTIDRAMDAAAGMADRLQLA